MTTERSGDYSVSIISIVISPRTLRAIWPTDLHRPLSLRGVGLTTRSVLVKMTVDKYVPLKINTVLYWHLRSKRYSR